MITVLDNLKPKARKEHKCNFCNGTIRKGEVYEKQTCVHDGDLYTWKTHEKCSWLAMELNMYAYCDDGVTDQDFQEYINDAFADLWEQYEGEVPIKPTFDQKVDIVYDIICNPRNNNE